MEAIVLGFGAAVIVRQCKARDFNVAHHLAEKSAEVLRRRLLHVLLELVGGSRFPRMGAAEGVHRVVKNSCSNLLPEFVQYPDSFADGPVIPLVVAVVAANRTESDRPQP